jgi:hypothetical protein
MTTGPHEIESAIESVRAVLDALPTDFCSSDLCPTDHLRHVLDVLQAIAAERQPLDSSPGSPSRHWLPGLPDKRFEDTKELARKNLKAHAMGIREAVRIISDVHTSATPGSPGFCERARPAQFRERGWGTILGGVACAAAVCCSR